MPERTYTVKFKGRTIQLTNHDLEVFRDMYVADTELVSRMSELLWVDIYTLDAEFGIGPHDILGAIRALEQGEPATGIKPATQYRNLPLKGLWHKHYFSANFVVNNIILGLGKNGIEKLVKEVMNPAKSPTITTEMINELAQRVTREPLEKRDAAKKLTGEWIVYLRRGGKNYYLCCNTHNAGDQFIYDRIKDHCVRDFPELLTWIQEA
jgi:hypothetical protein